MISQLLKAFSIRQPKMVRVYKASDHYRQQAHKWYGKFFSGTMGDRIDVNFVWLCRNSTDHRKNVDAQRHLNYLEAKYHRISLNQTKGDL